MRERQQIIYVAMVTQMTGFLVVVYLGFEERNSISLSYVGLLHLVNIPRSSKPNLCSKLTLSHPWLVPPFFGIVTVGTRKAELLY